MHNQRPNTFVIILLLFWEMCVILWESLTKGGASLFDGMWRPLKARRTLRLWHWIAIDGPKKFWQSPRMIQVGRSISTFIQVVFYPKK